MNSPQIIIISAMSENGLIGSGDGMPWNVEAEYQSYLNHIRGNTVIMGRRSYEIFGADLTSKTNIVVSRSVDTIEGAQVFKDFQSALRFAKSLTRDIFIAGGASIYKLGLEVADALYLSTIKGDFTGDVYFPQVDWSRWKGVRRERNPEYEFVEYRRVK